MFKQFNRKHGRIRKSLMIPHNSQCVNHNKPCLSKGSSVYACNALSNVSLDGNILYLVGPSHPKPVMHKNKLRETKENNWGRAYVQLHKICPTSSMLARASMASKHNKINHKMGNYTKISNYSNHVTSSICNIRSWIFNYLKMKQALS